MLIDFMTDPHTRWVAGCMTGTSLDGLDVTLAHIRGKGLDLEARSVGTVSQPLGNLRTAIKAFTAAQPAPPIEYMRASRRLGELHADAVRHLCDKYLPAHCQLDFVVAHGQTVWHAPDEHLSWQLLDPWPIARRFKVPVCHDLRQADLIACGEGAPITPLADWILLCHAKRHRLIVNLGGICNITFLPAGCQPNQVTGRDITACNLLIDGFVQVKFPHLRYDQDGQIGKQGQLADNGNFIKDILESKEYMDRFADQRSHGQSLGRENFSRQNIEFLLRKAPENMSPHDLVATAVDYVALGISAAIETQRSQLKTPHANLEIVLAGGGARNLCLLERIKTHCNRSDQILLIDDLGIPCQAREALAFATLGALSQDRIPISQSQVTGSTNPLIAGTWIFP